MADVYITSDLVRAELCDAAAADNPLLGSVEFTPEQINLAMIRACRRFNNVEPIGINAPAPDQLPAVEGAWMDGIAWALYETRLSQLRKQDIDYSAGGVQANLVSKQIAHLQNALVMHQKNFLEWAMNVKVAENLRACWGSV